MTSVLFTPAKVGDLQLPNRMVLSPMTRGRCPEAGVPNALNAIYYVQRASAGLLITEGTHISDQAVGWVGAAGIYTPDHVAGWKKVVDAVHAAGGRIFCQLWHTGRASHSKFREGTSEDPRSVAASAIAMEGTVVHVPGGKVPAEVPRELSTEEVAAIPAEYKHAAQCAKEAGFDGVEVHCANGYLLDGFLQSKTNKRTDQYGGSQEGRFRLIKEVIEAVAEVYPAGRIGVKISPNGAFNDMGSPDFREAFVDYAHRFSELGLGYMCVVIGLTFGFHELGEPMTCAEVRSAYGGGVIMTNCGYGKESAEAEIGSGAADLVAFGRPWISNPDLVERYAQGAPLNPDAPPSVWDHKGGPLQVGYTDYPAMNKVGS
jgi:N-ethylmaleimide reductase